MTTNRTLLRRQLRAFRASWAGWVLLSMIILFAVISPVTALLMPELLRSVAGESMPVDFSELPEPTTLDSWGQWVSNLSQVGVILVAILASSPISSDIARGTAIPVLTLPVSRTRYLWSSVVLVFNALVLSIVLGTAVLAFITQVSFGNIDGFASALAASTLWLLFSFSVAAVTLAASAAGASTLGAAGVGIGYFALCAAGSMWGPAARFTPSGMLSAMSDAGSGMLAGTSITGSATATVVVIAVALLAAVLIFQRRELL